MIFTMYVSYCEAIHHRLQLKVHDPGIGDVSQALLVSEDGNQGLVVNAEDELVQAHDKKFAFLKAIYGCLALSLYRVIPRLSRGAKSAPTEDSLPSSRAASWEWVTRAATVLLGQPETHPQLCPVCSQGSGEGWVKTSHAAFTLPYYFLF